MSKSNRAGGSKLFTVVMDFQGTTSVSQVRAIEASDALMRWVHSLKTDAACGLTSDQRTRLLNAFDVEVDKVTSLGGVRNVWCATISVPDGGLAVLNIIATAEIAGGPRVEN